MKRLYNAMVASGLIWLGNACSQLPEQRSFLVDQPRLLAVTSPTPELRPGEQATLTGVFAGGDELQTTANWWLCLAPKSPAEDNSVAPGCVAPAVAAGATSDSANLQLVATASREVTITMPADACARFGPDTPPGDFRPRNPDATGGFYAPVRIDVDDTIAIHSVRVLCNLAGTSPELAQQYAQDYQPNTAPTLQVDLPATAIGGSTINIQVAWPAASQQRFLRYDPVQGALVTQAETLGVALFVTAGTTDVDGLTLTQARPAGQFTLTAPTMPTTPTTISLWLVARDSRGGIAVSRHQVTVTPPP